MAFIWLDFSDETRHLQHLHDCYESSPRELAGNQYHLFERALRGQQFDKYTESLLHGEQQGIKMDKYEKFLEHFARAHSLPEQCVDSLRTLEFADESNIMEKTFCFQKGANCPFLYMRIMAMQQDGGDKIDIAFLRYTIDFQFTKEKHVTTKETKYLFGLFSNVQEHVQYHEATLGTKDAVMEDYFTFKAFNKLIANGVLPADAEVPMLEDV